MKKPKYNIEKANWNEVKLFLGELIVYTCDWISPNEAWKCQIDKGIKDYFVSS